MRTANTKSNLNYNEVNHSLNMSSDIEVGSKEWYKSIKKTGYRYVYRYIDTDEYYTYFATNYERASEGASQLYAKDWNLSIKDARHFYRDTIEIIHIDYIINSFLK